MRVSRMAGQVAAVTLTLLAASMFIPGKGRGPDPLIAAPLTEISAGCIAYCSWCGINKHKITMDSPLWNAKTNHLEECNTGDCEQHSCATENLASIRSLWTKFQTAHPSALPALLAANVQFAAFNAERGAIQFTCDAGNLIGNLPLSEERMKILVAAQTH